MLQWPNVGFSWPRPLSLLTAVPQMDTAKAVVRRLYKKTGLSIADVDVAEVHDCFSIAELASQTRPLRDCFTMVT